jgi:N-acetylglucosaminyldiphosphoundecaprenol N-acetyl-beta-D-mannosaminyltransferase
MLPRRVNVLGVGISEINYTEALRLIDQAVDSRRRGYVTVTGVHGVSECQTDEALRSIHNASFLSTPDGMPMVWAGKLAGSTVMDRVYGPDLMKLVLKEGVAKGWKHYLFGGGDGVAEKLKACLERDIPGLQICGIHTPPFRPLTETEEGALISEIDALQPHCFWVGLSTPKQERFMSRMTERFAPCLMFGVGAAFDFHAGLVPQAPPLLQKVGMEWFYRLCKEPKRLWRRYLKNNPLFIFRFGQQLLGLRTDPLPSGVEVLQPRL